MWHGPVGRLSCLVVIAPACRAGDPGSNPDPGKNFSLKLTTHDYQMIILKTKFSACTLIFFSQYGSIFLTVSAHG